MVFIMRVLFSNDLRTGLVLGAGVVLEDGEIVEKNTILDEKIIKKISQGLASDTPVFVLDMKELEPKLVEDDSLTKNYVSYLANQFRYLFLTSISDANGFDKLNAVMKEYFMRNRSVLTEVVLLRDDHRYTFEHSINVAMLSTMIGMDLELSDKELYNLIVGAVLHDIGKIQISNSILDKPSKLTDAEFRSIQNHPKYGVQLSNGLESVNDDVRRIILQHHEKLNGTGYPDGLSECKIDPLARIVTVSDIFDAVASNRSYHTAKSTYKSMLIVQGDADKGLIDNNVADALKRNIILYPQDTILTLSNGMTCIVIQPDEEDNRPVVYDTISQRVIDLSKEPSLQIIDAV